MIGCFRPKTKLYPNEFVGIIETTAGKNEAKDGRAVLDEVLKNRH